MFAALESIPQTSLGHIYQGFDAHHWLCLDKDDQSISNDLYLM
jgi:hypothetical protein